MLQELNQRNISLNEEIITLQSHQPAGESQNSQESIYSDSSSASLTIQS
jgi:hypothetical protein